MPEPLLMSGRRVPRRRRRVFLLRRLLLVALLVLLGLLIWIFLVELFQPFHGSGQGHVRVLIPKSASVNQVADILSHDDVIDSSFFFKLRVTLAGDQHKLFAKGDTT